MMVARLRSMTAATLLAIGTGLAGCGGSDPHGAADPPDFDITQVMEQTSDFQRELLVDGKVTFAEYELATLAAIECIQNEGVVVEGPEPRDGDERFLTYHMLIEDMDHEVATEFIDSVSDKCGKEFSEDVSRVWEYQHLLTPAQREDQRVLVIECLQAGGVEVPDDATEEEVFVAFYAAAESHEAVLRDCRDRYRDFFTVGVK